MTKEVLMITLADRITPHSHPPINQPQRQRIANMGLIDRAATGVLGAGLIGLGITRRTLPSLIASIAGGGALLAMAAAGYCPIYDVFGINNARKGTAEPADYYDEGIHVEVNYTIAKSPQELFQFWRNFENLPKFMHHLKAVICKSPTRSHWIARGPAGIDVEWDAEIINEEPNRLISWRTVGEADVDSAGTVRFLPDGPGTQVHVNLDYIPPAGRVGMAIAKIFSEEPEQQIREDLQRFKQLMETGEIPTTAGQSGGLCK